MLYFVSIYSVPKDSSYSEMICVGCVKKNPFLAAYAGLAVNAVFKDKNVSEAAAARFVHCKSINVCGTKKYLFQILSKVCVLVHDASFTQPLEIIISSARWTSRGTKTGRARPRSESSMITTSRRRRMVLRNVRNKLPQRLGRFAATTMTRLTWKFNRF